MEKVRLTEVCKPKQWKTLSTNELKDNGKYLVYGANGIIGYYDEYNHEKETVLITCRGATCGNVHISKEKSYINGNAMALDDLNEKVCLKEYLYYFLKQYDMKKVISGSAQPQITVQSLKNVEINLTDIETQWEIVKNLDNVQEIIDIRKNQIKELEELIKSQFVEMFGKPLINERNWKIEKAGMVCEKITDGSHYSPRNKGKGYPMLSVKDMRNDGFHYENCKYISIDDYVKLKNMDCVPKKNDLLISKDGSYFYYGFVVEQEKEEAILSSIAILRPNIQEINPYYLRYYMMSREIVNYVSLNYVTGAALKRVILKGIRDIPVMLPPINEQNQFAEFVKLIDKQKSEIQKSLEEVQKLQECLMNKYFD